MRTRARAIRSNMSGLEILAVVGCVAAVCSAYHDGSELMYVILLIHVNGTHITPVRILRKEGVQRRLCETLLPKNHQLKSWKSHLQEGKLCESLGLRIVRWSLMM